MQDNSRATQSAVESPKHFKCGTPKGNVIKFINSFSICCQKPVEGMWAHPLRPCSFAFWGSPVHSS